MTVFKALRLPAWVIWFRSKEQKIESRRESDDSPGQNPMQGFESVLASVVGLSIRQWRE